MNTNVTKNKTLMIKRICYLLPPKSYLRRIDWMGDGMCLRKSVSQ